MVEINNSRKSERNIFLGNVIKFFSGRHSYVLATTAIVIWIIFTLLTEGLYLSPRNLWAVLVQFTLLGFVTTGMVILMIVRSIDLSVSAVMILVVVIGSTLIVDYKLNPFLVIPLMLLICLLCAAWQGFFVAKIAIPAFIVTLAGMLYLRGIGYVLAGSTSHIGVGYFINSLTAESVPLTLSVTIIIILFLLITFFLLFNNFQAKKNNYPYKKLSEIIVEIIPIFLIFALFSYVSVTQGLPWLVLILVLFILIYYIILHHTVFGRYVFAVGGNPIVAKLAGINVDRIIFLSFILMGFSYFFASIGVMSRIDGFSVALAPDIELNAIAAAVIGGVNLFGGAGTISGAILGAFLLTSINNGMNLLNISSFYQDIARGLILLIALFVNVYAKKRKK